MYAGSIQRILAVSNTKESGALLISLGSKLWNIQKLSTALKLTVLFSIVNNVLGNSFADT